VRRAGRIPRQVGVRSIVLVVISFSLFEVILNITY